MPYFTIYDAATGDIASVVNCPSTAISAQVGAGQAYIAGAYPAATFYIDVTATPDVPVARTDTTESGTEPTLHGIPTGGTTGQALVKASNADYDVSWDTISGTAVSAGFPPTRFDGGPPSDPIQSYLLSIMDGGSPTSTFAVDDHIDFGGP